MDMTSIRIADFKGCQRSKIISISLFQAGLFPKYNKIVCLHSRNLIEAKAPAPLFTAITGGLYLRLCLCLPNHSH